MEKVFYDLPQNTGRQYEIDLARAVVIFFLAPIHVAIACSTYEALGSGIPYILDTVIGGPFSAPMYMFAMGLGMFYTRKSSPKDYFLRGARLLALGYVLNIFRSIIPYLIGYKITGNAEKYLEPLLFEMLGNDILVFAGISMMLMAGLFAIHTNRSVLLILALASSALGTLLKGINVGNDLGNIFLGYLIGTENARGETMSYFPLLNWIIFPLAGYLFASILVRVRDKKTFYLWLSLPCALFTIVYFILGIRSRTGMFGVSESCFYHLAFSDAIASLILTLALIGLYYFLSLILPQWFLRLAGTVSRNITEVYFIHWIFVSVITDLLLYIVRGSQILTSSQILLLGTAISIASIAIAHYLRAFTKKAKRVAS